MRERYDAVVVGAGPNGLAAAIRLAKADRSVLVLEGADAVGGGARTKELTLPGFRHDVCSAIHPLGIGSPYLRTLPLHEHGLEWVHPDIPVAHPLDDGPAVLIERSLAGTAAGLGRDAATWRRTYAPLVRRFDQLALDTMAPLTRMPHHPLLMARFARHAVRSAQGWARSRFTGERARAAVAGMAGHNVLAFDRPFTAALGVLFPAAAHAVGFPMARGGSQAIADAMASLLRSLGGEIRTGTPVRDLADVPPHEALLFDLTPRQMLAIVGDRAPGRLRQRVERFRHGPGVFKVDYALDGPVPWSAQDTQRAGTVHLGGTLEEVAAAELATAEGRHAERPYIIAAQQTLFDPTRAPDGRHTLWAYCHVPSGSTVDMTGPIEDQLERFAPGFRDRILARSTMTTADLEDYNPNYIGGDISAGAHSGLQLLLRPWPSLDPYALGETRWFLCSASTPPGAGVHGMCGYYAAGSVLRHVPAR
ncbi:MAG: NAD(P)/FAD-dependent oxidoreductase [Actinobacteria bacterium]|nr:NAD(P)/FAD-dependent oxidoreductase [Actinomycetota bacterium]